MRTAILPVVGLAVAGLLLPSCGGGGGGGGGSGGRSRAALVVQSVDPADGSESVPADKTVTLRFNTPMDGDSLASGALVLTPAGVLSPVPATITPAPDRLSATLDPDGPLEGGRLYQVRLSELAQRSDGRTIRHPWFSDFRVVSGGAPPPPPPPPTQTGSVAATGSMETGRSGHAAAALPDGRVAVFGGFRTDSAVTGSIELFDPDTGTWTTSAAVLNPARARLTATVQADGRVLLAGGETGSATDVGTDRWELFDPALDAVTHAGTLAERRTRHRAVLLGSGRVLLVGGSRTDSPGAPNYSRATAELFDPATRTSSTAAAMGVPRAGHEATLLGDGTVLVTGGHGSDARAERYDPSSGLWSSAGTMVEARRDHTATLLADGSVLAAGGGTFTAERWLPGSNQWVQMQNMGELRSLHVAVRIGNGRVMIAGGEKPTAQGGTFFHQGTEFFNPPTGSFVFPPIYLRAPRSGHGATVLPGGDILVTGGKSSVAGADALRSCDRVHLD